MPQQVVTGTASRVNYDFGSALLTCFVGGIYLQMEIQHARHLLREGEYVECFYEKNLLGINKIRHIEMLPHYHSSPHTDSPQTKPDGSFGCIFAILMGALVLLLLLLQNGNGSP